MLAARRYRLLVVLVLVLGLAAFVYRIRRVLTPFVLGGVLAYLIYPPVVFLSRKGFSRTTSILAVYAVAAVLLVGTGIFVVPRTVDELQGLAAALPGLVRQVQLIWGRIQRGYSAAVLPQGVREALDDRFRQLEEAVPGLIESTLAGIVRFLARLPDLALSPVLAFYLLKDAEKIRAGFLDLVPAAWRAEVGAMLGEIDEVLSGFVRAQLLVSAFVALLVIVGMWALGIPFALLVGIVAGAAEVIPYFGPIIGAIPGIMLGLLKSPLTGLYAALVFGAIQQVESNFVSPRVVGARVYLHPVVVIFALFVGGELFGLIGLLVAVPATAGLRVIARRLYARVVS